MRSSATLVLVPIPPSCLMLLRRSARSVALAGGSGIGRLPESHHFHFNQISLQCNRIPAVKKYMFQTLISFQIPSNFPAKAASNYKMHLGRDACLPRPVKSVGEASTCLSLSPLYCLRHRHERKVLASFSESLNSLAQIIRLSSSLVWHLDSRA